MRLAKLLTLGISALSFLSISCNQISLNKEQEHEYFFCGDCIERDDGEALHLPDGNWIYIGEGQIRPDGLWMPYAIEEGELVSIRPNYQSDDFW